MKKIVAISAGHIISKKDAEPFRRQMKYLNYGLLGLVTLLNEYAPVDIQMFQANELLPSETLALIEKEMTPLSQIDELLLSIPSFYSISWCREFCMKIKQLSSTRIVAGGRWVVDGNREWIWQRIPDIDEIIEGFGEEALLRRYGSKKIIDGRTQCFKRLNYRLLYDFSSYQPCIEVSRGCGAGCLFCADRNNQRIPNKSVPVICQELDDLDELFPAYSYYMEAPHFVFENEWCDQLYRELRKREQIHLWRCTSRVESVRLELLGKLAETGLKVIDVGLESASPTQLKRMKKTNYPEKYLEMAHRLLEASERAGIWIKFNLLLFAGETKETIEETKDWLKENKALIKNISVSSLIYYRNMNNLEDLISLGAKRPDEDQLERNGYVNLDLSDDVSYELAHELTISLPKIVSSQKDYYDIKSITYYPVSYTYQEFLQDVDASINVPFRRNDDIAVEREV